MASAEMKAREVRKRLLLDRISLERAELAAHLRGVKRAVSWVAIGAGAIGALSGVRGLLGAGKAAEVVTKARDLILPVLGSGPGEKLIQSLLAIENLGSVAELRPLLQT